MDSNENKETCSIIENSDSSKEIENDETKIIYVRELIKEKYALYFIYYQMEQNKQYLKIKFKF